MFSLFPSLCNFVKTVYNWLFREPFYQFYLKGPKIVGCWEGISPTAICSQISGTASTFWEKHTIECDTIIHHKFEAHYITIMTAFYCLFIYKIIQFVWWRYFVYKPFMNDVNNIITNCPTMYIENKSK